MRTGAALAMALGALLTLHGCGGMNRAVGVLPTAADRLEQQSRALRGVSGEPERRARGEAFADSGAR